MSKPKRMQRNAKSYLLEVSKSLRYIGKRLTVNRGIPQANIDVPMPKAKPPLQSDISIPAAVEDQTKAGAYRMGCVNTTAICRDVLVELAETAKEEGWNSTAKEILDLIDIVSLKIDEKLREG